MTALLLDILLAGIACWQAVETWHHGSLFAPLRKWLLQQTESPTPIFQTSGKLVWVYFGTLVLCPFCLSHWAAAGLFLLLWLTDPLSAWRLPVYWLVAVRVAQLLNDLLHPWCRSPGETPDEELELDLEAPDEPAA